MTRARTTKTSTGTVASTFPPVVRSSSDHASGHPGDPREERPPAQGEGEGAGAGRRARPPDHPTAGPGSDPPASDAASARAVRRRPGPQPTRGSRAPAPDARRHHRPRAAAPPPARRARGRGAGRRSRRRVLDDRGLHRPDRRPPRRGLLRRRGDRRRRAIPSCWSSRPTHRRARTTDEALDEATEIVWTTFPRRFDVLQLTVDGEGRRLDYAEIEADLGRPARPPRRDRPDRRGHPAQPGPHRRAGRRDRPRSPCSWAS